MISPRKGSGPEQDLTDKIFRLGDELAYPVILSFLWLLFSLPLITVPAATAAVYGTLNGHIVDGRKEYVKPFITVFRQSFTSITARGSLLVVAVVLFGFNSYFYLTFVDASPLRLAAGALQLVACLVCIAVSAQFFWASGVHWNRGGLGQSPGLRDALLSVRDRPIASFLTVVCTTALPLLLLWLALWQFAVFIVGVLCYVNTRILVSIRK